MASYRHHTATTRGTRTNTTLVAPTGIADGDELLIYFLMAAASVAALDALPPTWPTGFAVVGGPVTVSEGNNAAAFSIRTWLVRKRASGEGGNYTVTHAGASTDGLIVAVRDGANNPAPQVTTSDGDGTGNVTFTGVTTSGANCWLGAFAHNWQNWGSGTPPNGTTPTFTERLDSASNTVYFAEGTWAGSGATGSPTKDSDNAGANDQWAAMLVAVEDAAAAAGGLPWWGTYGSTQGV